MILKYFYQKLSKLLKNLVLRIFPLEIYTKILIKRMIFVVYSSLFLSLLMSLSLTHLRCIWDGLLVGSLVNIKEADDGLLWGAEKEQRLITATISMSSTFKGAQPGNRSREAKAKLVHFRSSHLQQEEVAAQCPLISDNFDKIIVIMANISFTSSTQPLSCGAF